MTRTVSMIILFLMTFSLTMNSTQASQPGWEYERERRIKLDYSLTKDELLQQLQSRLNGVTEALFEQWDQEGRFDRREIDGEIRYISPSVSNLLFRYPDAKAMRKTPPSETWGRFVASMVEETNDENYEKLLPQRFHNRMTVTVEQDAVEPGEFVYCWLPIPQQNPFQSNVIIHSATPETKNISDDKAEHRSVYFESQVHKSTPVVFEVEYSYTSHARVNRINPDRVSSALPDSVKHWTKEQPPHVMFTDELAQKTKELIGGEHNPYWKAKKIYLWMTNEFNYSYAREYSTIPNISQYCFNKRYGDCGQLALTFITMCRIAGIPARWETGWMLYPDLKNLHDWCVIYLSPYGWVPVDVNLAIAAKHQWTFLSKQDKDNIIDFYFGNMDPYRMAVNSNHGAKFHPPKEFVRSDTVDFQRGEVETEQHNLYYDAFDYELEIVSNTNVFSK